VKYDLAVIAAPLLREALGNVLGARPWMARVSAAEAEALAEILRPATLGLYLLVSGISEAYPTLAPTDADMGDQEFDFSEETVDAPTSPDTGAGFGTPLHAETVDQVSSDLKAAEKALDQLDSAVEHAGGLPDDERLSFQEHVTNARSAITLAKLRLLQPQ